ncbi:O-antigen ligase [Winogradskyella sp.]|uniref:O-antigen ligase family protein n=1 Tax=Winogradskyella sp. TaxID=1883156 RepID=UPI0026130DAA|nr:O-antigen ligase family protein [Winogradskyella sp.]
MNLSYIHKITIHIILGLLLYNLDFFPRLFYFGVIAYFLISIFNAAQSDKTTTILQASAYIVGVEVLFRMTGAGVFYESSKYLVILFMVIGMTYNGLSNRSYPYMIFLFLLIPSILVASLNTGIDANLRKNVAFVLSGPACLGISALYCFNKRLNHPQLKSVILHLGLPIISLTTYLFLYTVRLEEIFKGTQSNFAASGGFGPNQVSTVLGLGMFVFCVNFFLSSKSTVIKGINILLFGLISYRAIITFSRGGVLTAILMIIGFLGIFYLKTSLKSKRRISLYFVMLLFASSVIWLVSSSQTSGLIDKRYSNQDASGRVKEDVSAGRVEIFKSELEGFYSEPIFGVGASVMKERRKAITGETIATHSELSRMISEHGILGVIMLLILLITPLAYRINNTRNYLFYAFLIFWFATINHSAMRIAAPGFIYALALLNITYEKRPLHRKRVIRQG